MIKKHIEAGIFNKIANIVNIDKTHTYNVILP